MAKKRRSSSQSSSVQMLLDRALVYATSLLVFSIPLFLLTSISEYGYGKTIFALVGISLLSMLWGARGWIARSQEIRFPWISVPFLAFVIASALSLINAINGRVVIQSLVLVVFFFQLLLIIANVIRERKDVHLLLFALLASGFIAGLYGLLQYLGVAPGPFGGTGTAEMISTLGNKNYLGGFLAYLLFPSVILVIAPRRRSLRVVAMFMIAFCFGVVLLLNQTGVTIALILTFVALLVGLAIFRPIDALCQSRRWLMILLALLTLTFFLGAPSSPLNSVLGLSSEGEPSWIGRIWRANSGDTRSWDWWIGWEMFTDAPIVGIGLGNYKLNFMNYKAQFLATPRGEAYDFHIARAAQAHNDYVQTLSETGILGGAAVLGVVAILVLSFWLRVRRTQASERKLELILLACGVVPILIHALASFPAHLPASSLIFIAMVGLAHSRCYGDAAILKIAQSGWKLRGRVIATACIGLVVSIFAVSDLHANVLMYEGIQQSQLGNSFTAESLLTRSLRYDFAPRQTYFHLASVQLRQGRLEEAWENLERCMTRFIDEAVLLTYANLAANRGELDTAQAAIDVLLAGPMKGAIDQQARYIESGIAIRRGQIELAIQLLESLTQDHRKYETGFLALGEVYASQGLSNLARDNLDRALRIIDSKLRTADKKLAAGNVITVAEYGQLRSQIDLLTQQRSLVVDRLEGLP